MEALARAGGDVERVADVLRRDLSSPYDFLRVAEVYREAGRVEDAIEWAEREIEAFPERGCDEALWLELAERRKKSHPENALRVYLEQIEPTIARQTKQDYEQPVRLIDQAGALLRRLGREDELPSLIAEIRAHARKRNLIALLDRMPLQPAAS